MHLHSKANLKFKIPGLMALVLLLCGCDFGSSPGGGGTGGQGLTGILVDANGAPAANVTVRVYPEGFVPAVESFLAKSAHSTAPHAESTLTDAEGRFRFAGLSNGRYNVQASLRHEAATYAVFIQGIPLEKSIDLGRDTLRLSGSVRMRVRTSTGAAVSEGHCSIPGSPWSEPIDSAGVCLLQDVAPGSVPVQVVAGGMAATGSVTVLEGQESEGNLYVPQGASFGSPSWHFASLYSYTFYLPPDMQFVREVYGIDGWGVTYQSPSAVLTIKADVYGADVDSSTFDHQPDFSREERVFNDSTYATLFRYRIAQGPEIDVVEMPFRAVMQIRRRVGSTWSYSEIFEAAGMTSSDGEDIARILRSVRQWEGPGPAPESPPPKPILKSPATNSHSVSRTAQQLSWNSVGNTASYHLQVATDPRFQNIVYSDSAITGLSGQTGGPIAASTRFYWRVRAKRDLIVSAWSDVWNFTTLSEAP